MTKEQQLKAQRFIKEKGGSIDQDGGISSDTIVYTTMIKDLLELGARIFYNPQRRYMQMSNWDADLMKEPTEPEWKQKVREILGARSINDEGYIEGTHGTDDVRRILKAGGYLMVLSGKACISNWEDC